MPRAPLAFRLRSLPAALVGALAFVAACETPMPDPAAPPAPAPPPPPVVAAPPPASPPAPEPVSLYDKPPPAIMDVLHAAPSPRPVISPTNDAMILVSWQEYPSIARVATPFLRLAGVRVEPKNHSRHDTNGGYGITACATRFSILRVADSAEIPVTLPDHPCAQRPLWSADSKRFAFQNITDLAVELWVGDAATGAVQRVPGAKLNPMLGSTVQWMPDQKTLLVKTVPSGLGAPPPPPAVPQGPSIQESDGRTGESSTYETRDTLEDTHDEDLFDHYASTQLALVDAASLAVTPLGKVGLYDDVDPSPDGAHVLVTAVHKPYSYVTTFGRFPHDVDVWDRSGATVHSVAKLPLFDRVPVHGVPTGPRGFSWRATEPATLVWSEALDGGDWKVNVPARDKVMLARAPFAAAPVELLRTEQRFDGFWWGERPGLALMREEDENRHWVRTFQVNVDDPSEKPRVVWDQSSDERYKHPGYPVFKPLPSGVWVMKQEGDSIFLSGEGASTEGDRPFIDRFDLKTQKAERLYRTDHDSVESFLSFAGNDTRSFLTWRQSPTDRRTRTCGRSGPPSRGGPRRGRPPTARRHARSPTSPTRPRRSAP
jgi:dipeptidyl aminopeptidase/acylaminoacyl peptidase